MPSAHRALTALVVVHDRRGVAHYTYAGQTLAGDFDPDRLAQLVEDGHLEPVTDEVVADAERVPFAGPPAKGAKKAVWEAYAREVGVPEADIAGLDKPGLIEAALAAGHDLVRHLGLVVEDVEEPAES
jgi:hypothetical protein